MKQQMSLNSILNSILAVILFYTRIPISRRLTVPEAYFKCIVQFWPMAGWITASVMGMTLAITSFIFPYPVAVALAILSRVIITGALHEDGLSDWADGFFGGHTRDKILAIMKDSHTGTFGILSLIFYFLLLFLTLSSLPLYMSLPLILIADPLSKGISSTLPFFLPYARPYNESKYYTELKMASNLIPFTIIFAIVPYLLITVYALSPLFYLSAVPLIPLFFILIHWLKRKIGGFTGDTCGAIVLLLELTFYLTALCIYTLSAIPK